MDYPCAKFGDFSFSCFGFIVLTDRQTDTHTHTHTESQPRMMLSVIIANKIVHVEWRSVNFGINDW